MAAGFGATHPDSDDYVPVLVSGDRVDGSSWRSSNTDTFPGTTAMEAGKVYLVLARFDFSTPDETPFNPYNLGGSLRGRMKIFAEGEALPLEEEDIVWDLGPYRGK